MSVTSFVVRQRIRGPSRATDAASSSSSSWVPTKHPYSMVLTQACKIWDAALRAVFFLNSLAVNELPILPQLVVLVAPILPRLNLHLDRYRKLSTEPTLQWGVQHLLFDQRCEPCCRFDS